MSLHPPHLIDSTRSLTPAALIPFCAYQTNMTLLGQTRKDLPFTVCDQFQPTVLEGQRCFLLDLSRLKKMETKSGKSCNGLFLVIDTNYPNMANKKIGTEQYQKKKRNVREAVSLNIFPSATPGLARITLNTMTRFTEYSSGRFSLSGLKKMSGTKSFMGLPDDVKKCQLESFNSCQLRKYIEKVQKNCGCLPWTIGITLKSKVIQIM